MNRSACLISCLLVVACSSDDGESTQTDAAPGAMDASGAPDAGPAPCFEFSLDPDIPLAIDGTFVADSETWRRPHDEEAVCPATALLPTTAAQVPYVAYSFCNNDSVEHRFDFEMLSDQGPEGQSPLDDPYLFLYRGRGIPADALSCLAVNDDIIDALDSKDSEILGITVPPGEAITVVGTTFTFAAGEDVGTGYYVLVTTNAD